MKKHLFKKLQLLMYAFMSGVCLLILSNGTAWAVWCATSECSNCGRHNWSKGEECKYDSQAACEKEIARIKWEMGGAGVYTCYKKGSSGGSPGGISTDSTTNMVQGILNNNSQQFGIGLFGAMIQDASRRNSEASAESARQAEESARRQAEDKARAAEALRLNEEKRDRLLSSMMNVGDSSQIGLMGADSGSGLGLMTDDLQVRETQGTFGQTELKPIMGDAGTDALKPDNEAEKGSSKARQGFDTAGKLKKGGLPAAPSVPPTRPVSPAKLEKINLLKAALKKNQDEEKSLWTQLENLMQSQDSDETAMKELQKKITAKQDENKNIKKQMEDLTAEDPDEPASNQPSADTGAGR